MVTKKLPTSASPPSISSTRKTSVAACRSPGVAAEAAEAVVDAEVAAAASVAAAADVVLVG